MTDHVLCVQITWRAELSFRICYHFFNTPLLLIQYNFHKTPCSVLEYYKRTMLWKAIIYFLWNAHWSQCRVFIHFWYQIKSNQQTLGEHQWNALVVAAFHAYSNNANSMWFCAYVYVFMLMLWESVFIILSSIFSIGYMENNCIGSHTNPIKMGSAVCIILVNFKMFYSFHRICITMVSPA